MYGCSLDNIQDGRTWKNYAFDWTKYPPPPIPQIDFKLLASQTEVNKIKINNNFFYQKVLEKIKNVLNFYI